MERTASPVDISQQEPVASPEAPTQSPDPEPSAAAATHAAPYDPMEVVRAMSRFSDVPALHEDPPPPPSPSDSASSYGSAPHLDVDDANSVRLSRISVAMSDDVSGIGLSMLQDFISGTAEDDDSDSDSDREPASSARSSLEEAVQGFPTPPTQIPTPSSHTTSFILEAPPVRPASTHASESDYSEDPDGDGASFYDNYRYSRFSISSKMSKSSAHTGVLAPPPVPTELPPPVRRRRTRNTLRPRTQYRPHLKRCHHRRSQLRHRPPRGHQRHGTCRHHSRSAPQYQAAPRAA
ncbi:hypothetical protein BC834DRAFT_433204 [Gloeopeniophorella convolvens]|nr:hypothetical protein BC834DRAFT_433204 [Gloeopeniophorella convolvens]